MTEFKAKRLLHDILTTEPNEADCLECFRELDRFAEMYQSGTDPAAIMPRIEAHLNRCGDCSEEYQALLSFLKSEAESGSA